MYSRNGRQFVFRESTGELRNIYHDPRYGICYCTLTKRNTWTSPVLLNKAAFPSFHADMDESDCYHILFQDMQGSIHYTYMGRDQIKTVPVLNSKTPLAYEKHLFILPLGKSVFFFYILKHESSNILACQILNNGSLGNPKVVDYIAQSSSPYSIAAGKNNYINVFYQSADSSHYQVGFKKYNIEKKSFGDFVTVSKAAGSFENPRAVADTGGVIHLCCQHFLDRQYELLYTQKQPDKDAWSEPVCVAVSQSPFENFSILRTNDNVTIFWVKDDIISYSLGKQSGAVWERPSRYSFPVPQRLLCLSYKSNNPYEADRVAIDESPGTFAGGLKLAFYQPPSENGENLTPEELRSLILDTLKLLRNGLDELKASDESLRNEINKLIDRQDVIDRELVKLSYKLDGITHKSPEAEVFESMELEDGA